MLSIAGRALNAVFAVAAAIFVATRWGDSPVGKLTTVAITAGVVALFEWLRIWAPRRSALARRLFDPRSVFVGVWMQHKVAVLGGDKAEIVPNRFAVFVVDYSAAIDAYTIEGTAYGGGEGGEHAHWDSVDVVHFAKDGRAMTYMFEGTITNPMVKDGDGRRRAGFTRLVLSSDDGGRGRVEHVARDVSFEFNFRRVTGAWLTGQGFQPSDPEKLRDPGMRDEFATAYARTLVPASS